MAKVDLAVASTPGLGARMFTALADRSINIDCISTSEMKVSCIIAEKYLDDAARAIHAEFFGQVVTAERPERSSKPAKKRAKPAAKRRAART